MTIKVGVIGTGNIGADHVTRLSSQVVGSTVTAVFDVDTARAEQVAASAGAVARGSALEVIDDPGVDAVVIASPGDLHAEQVLACIAAQKPVLCEKPLATTATDCLKVIEAEVATGRRWIQVGFMRRYDPGYKVVKDAVDDGTIGEALLAHMIHRNAVVPDSFTSPMAMTDSVVHEIDVTRWLFGQEIVRTTVVPTKPSPLAAAHVRDPQIVLLELAGGGVVTVEVFVNCQYGYDVRCEVVGSTGVVTLDNPSANVLVRHGRRAQTVPADWRVRFGATYLTELQEWITGLRSGVVGGPSAWDGYAATAVAECAVASLDSGAPVPVGLVERPGLYV
ncbi:myo-inositol 2-dehydrogenase [Nonomuraea polychroma]|uniref:Inositol 2-dehydrogenase n=1 Tax=Nonomuraea polychroma TaxID=46176 RepID=A0A438LZC8_9ACTN|nr:Gfo/Idh/MocA family oxidoreductase [Nonomuraea polychroma]RVX38905.1 myo-inositol 2-dehydrogenase [Nonomuraea polychroma]